MQVLLLLALLASQQHNITDVAVPVLQPVATRVVISMTAPPMPQGQFIPTGPRAAYLTFDDGPSDMTRDILATLAQYDVKATFFVNGPYLNPDPLLYRETIAAGHALANHTYSHNYAQLYRSREAFLADVDRLDQYIVDNFQYTARVFRFPGGSNNTVSKKYGGAAIMPAVRQAILERGYVYFDWNVSAGDSRQTPTQIAANILNQSRSKTRVIILMHDHWNKPNTMKALPAIIQGLRSQGFEFFILDSSVEPMRYS